MANGPISWICAFRNVRRLSCGLFLALRRSAPPVRDDAHSWLARVRFTAPQEERRHSVEVTCDVEQVNNQ
jgi:hypothetical protein